MPPECPLCGFRHMMDQPCRRDAIKFISCNAHSDDGRINLTNNGIGWIRKQTDRKLEEIVSEGGGPGYSTDNALYSLQWMGDLRRYLKVVEQYGFTQDNGDSIGFSVAFDRKDLAKYIRRHRKKLWERVKEDIKDWLD